MKSLLSALVLLIFFSCCPYSAGQELAFRLDDIDGVEFELTSPSEKKLTVVCFLGTQCPLAKLYASRLSQMAHEFEDVQFVGICSNLQDSPAEVKAFRDQHEISFPVLKDRDNVIADQFDAERTPEVFLVDQSLEICYRGRIDDQYRPGLAKANATREDLKLAISQHLAGRPVEVAQTESFGCLIGRVKGTSDPNSRITFAKHISRILVTHCAECHQDGEIGPMSLTDYDEVIGWADMIEEVVDENRMPPWHADPNHGEFINERRMTDAEKQMLRDWVKAGTPMGDMKDLPVQEQVAKSDSEWQLPREPDLVVNMRDKPFQVPADGTVEYQYYVVDPGFKEDKWITAAEVLPGERSVLHHSIVFFRPPDGSAFKGIGWLTAYVPGQGAPIYNPKYGRRVPAGSKLVFQQHYTPTGKPKSDMTRVGLLFGDESQIEHEVSTVLALNQDFYIPPGDAAYEVNATFSRLPKNGMIHAFSPHMHYRGKSFELTAKVGDADRTLLNVPNYDFNWQHIYQLRDPMPISEIKSLQFTATFDNSENNLANPNPEEYVAWGDQTWEEMAVAFVVVSEPLQRGEVEVVDFTPEEKATMERRAKEIESKAKKFTDRFFERFDTNSDNVISSGELPRSTRTYGRWQMERTGDTVLSREEIMDAAKQRFRNKR